MAVSECARCQGLGWVWPEQPDAVGMVPCTCNQDAHLRYRLRQAEIPDKFLDCEIETFAPLHPTQTFAREKAREFAEAYPDVEHGLLFVGPTGVGKTHLAVAVLRRLIERGVAVRFVDCNALLARLRRSFDRDALESEYEILQPILDAEVLLLDDLGAHRSREWAYEVYITIVNHRYNYQKITLATTNILPLRAGERLDERLVAQLSQRVYSRLAEMCLIVEMDGPDYRTELRQKSFQLEERKAHATRASHMKLQEPVDLPETPGSGDD